MTKSDPITGRCYCSRFELRIVEKPQTVAYCHCIDCRRLSGAPVAAFAAFAPSDMQIAPEWPAPVSYVPGVERWFCPDCGTQMAASYDYLPGQIYVPIGLLDQVDQLEPSLHCHTGSAVSWLHIQDDLPRHSGSGRCDLVTSAAAGD